MLYNMTCVAPLRLPPPLLNMTLLSLFVFLRHGERTPVNKWMPPQSGKNESWLCDSDDAISPQLQSYNRPGGGSYRRYRLRLDSKTAPFPHNCAKGQLTTEGMRQLRDLGGFYRRELLLNRRIFSPNYGAALIDYYDDSFVEFRSSYSDRAVRSLVSFVTGLFPAEDPDDIVRIVSGSKSGREPLNPDPYGCQDLQDAYKAFISTDEFERYKKRAFEKQDFLYNFTGLEKTHETWQWFGDWLYSYYCSEENKHLIPPEVTDEMMEIAMNDTAYYSNGLFSKYREIGAGPIFRLLLESIDERISGKSQKKLTVFSGHDTTIAAITAFFGQANMKGIAPYRSHLGVEVYEALDPIVRFTLNGEVIKVEGEETITLSKLRFMTLQAVQKCIY